MLTSDICGSEKFVIIGVPSGLAAIGVADSAILGSAKASVHVHLTMSRDGAHPEHFMRHKISLLLR